MSRRAQVLHPVQADLVVVGVDVAKRKMMARGVAGDGREGRSCRIACTQKGFERLVGYAQQLTRVYGARGFVVAMEPTGHYGEPLAVWLLARGVVVYAVAPLKTSRAKDLYDGTWRKTDEKDALVVADLCRRGFGKPWRVLEGPFAGLRVLSRRREQLVQRRRRLVNRLHRHRDVVFPELGGLFRKLTGRTSLWVLGRVATPAKVLEMGVDELERQLRRVSRGQLGRERAEAMVHEASTSVGVQEAAATHELAMRQLLEELEEVQRLLEQLEARMQQQLREVPYAKQLLSVPGFGPIMVATLLGEFGDLRQYRVSRQLIKMAGLDLVENSSGERQGHRQISRRGRRYARQMLYMAALTAGKTALSERRRRLVQERNKPKRVAIVANACALLRIAHALARDGAFFDATRHQTAQVTAKAA